MLCPWPACWPPLLMERHVAQNKNDNQQDFSLARSKKVHCFRSCSTTPYGEWINSRVSLAPPPMESRGNLNDDFSSYFLGAVMGTQCAAADWPPLMESGNALAFELLPTHSGAQFCPQPPLKLDFGFLRSCEKKLLISTFSLPPFCPVVAFVCLRSSMLFTFCCPVHLLTMFGATTTFTCMLYICLYLLPLECHSCFVIHRSFCVLVVGSSKGIAP